MNRRGFIAGLLALPIVKPIINTVEPTISWYKAKTTMDAGVFYCPYVPLTTVGVSDEEETASTDEICRGSILTRYGEVQVL